MKIIEDQIQSCINSIPSDQTIKKMTIPFHWFAYTFARPENITLEGHDCESIVCHDENNNCLTIVITQTVR
jgi:hypothetical protein